MTAKKYKQIIGGTKEDAERKFPWLRAADFQNAIINITNSFLIWKGGTWEDGFWEGGRWEGGFWKSGNMWSNLKQKYLRVEYKNGKFVEVNKK